VRRPGPNLGVLLTAESDRIKERNRRRAKLRSVANSAAQRGDQAKASRIRRVVKQIVQDRADRHRNRLPLQDSNCTPAVARQRRAKYPKHSTRKQKVMINLELPGSPSWVLAEFFNLTNLAEGGWVFGYDDGRYDRLVSLGCAEAHDDGRYFRITDLGRRELAERK